MVEVVEVVCPCLVVGAVGVGPAIRRIGVGLESPVEVEALAYLCAGRLGLVGQWQGLLGPG